jgi:hypothetical protein
MKLKMTTTAISQKSHLTIRSSFNFLLTVLDGWKKLIMISKMIERLIEFVGFESKTEISYQPIRYSKFIFTTACPSTSPRIRMIHCSEIT